MTKLVQNAAGRMVPVEINRTAAIPFAGVGRHRPFGRKTGPLIRSCADYPANGDKRTGTIKQALVKAGLKDGMTIGTHHHLRDGDYVANAVFAAADERLGFLCIVDAERDAPRAVDGMGACHICA